jgi:hypothetical protein
MTCSLGLRHTALAVCLAVEACGSSAPPAADASAEQGSDTAPTPPADSGPGPEVTSPADGPVPDAAAIDEAPAMPDATAADGSAAAGQYTCTLNASTPYHVGAEHRGYTMFGTVVDTTPGADRARVGAIQSTVVAGDLLVKWVWPSILVKGHTYELAVFEDHLKNRTCMGSATAEPQWLFKIPAVAGDYEFKWIQPVPHTASCQDFPPGPIP